MPQEQKQQQLIQEQVGEQDFLSDPEVLGWKHHPVTQRFLAFQRGVAQDEQDLWLMGAYRSSSQHEETVNTARAQGRAEQAKRTADLIDSIQMPEKENKDGNQ